MRTKVSILISVGLFVSLVWVQADAFQQSTTPSSFLLAQAPANTPRPHAAAKPEAPMRDSRMREALQKLGLSKEQWQELRNVGAGSFRTISALRQTVKQLTGAPKTPETSAKLEKALQNLGAAQAKMRQQVKSILTPDQWARLQKVSPGGHL